MLRQVFILENDDILFSESYGMAFNSDTFKFFWEIIKWDVLSNSVIDGEIINRFFYKYRVTIISGKSKGLTFVFVTDLSNNEKTLIKHLEEFKLKTLTHLNRLNKDEISLSDIDEFLPEIEVLHQIYAPKISIVGYSGVGKTTISCLIQGMDIPEQHIPTITGIVDNIKEGESKFQLWDFAGQERYQYLWEKFLKGSDCVIIVLDSTLKNCEKSIYFRNLVKKEAPFANMCVIANKQDLSESMNLFEIAEIMKGVNVYSMVANEYVNRDMMISVIARTINSTVVNLQSYIKKKKKDKPKAINSVPELSEVIKLQELSKRTSKIKDNIKKMLGGKDGKDGKDEKLKNKESKSKIASKKPKVKSLEELVEFEDFIDNLSNLLVTFNKEGTETINLNEIIIKERNGDGDREKEKSILDFEKEEEKFDEESERIADFLSTLPEINKDKIEVENWIADNIKSVIWFLENRKNKKSNQFLSMSRNWLFRENVQLSKGNIFELKFNLKMPKYGVDMSSSFKLIDTPKEIITFLSNYFEINEEILA